MNETEDISSITENSSDKLIVEFTQAVFRFDDAVVVRAQKISSGWEVESTSLSVPPTRVLVDDWLEAEKVGGEMAEDLIKYHNTCDKAREELELKWPRHMDARNT